MKRVAALTLLLISAAANAGTIDCFIEGRWGARGVTRQFVRRGNLVFAAEGKGVAVYNISNPNLIEIAGHADTATPAVSLAITGDHLVVATSDALELYTVDGNGSLGLIERHSERTHSVAAFEGQVVTAGNDVTLWRIVNGRLQLRARQPFTRPIDAIALTGGTLFVAEHDYGVRIFDVAGDQLRQISIVATPAYGLAIIGTRLFTTGGTSGVFSFDISDRRNPKFESVVDVGLGDYRAIAAMGSTLYVGADFAQIRIYDASGGGTRYVASIDEAVDTLLASAQQLFVAGTRRDRGGLLSETGSPLRLFDLSSENQPRLLGQYVARAGGLTGAATDGTFAYVADPPLFRVLDLRSAEPREVASIAYSDYADRVRLFGKWAIVYGRLETHIIDISQPLQPRYSGVFHTQGNVPSRVAFAGDYLLEANQASGFHVLDLTDPTRPTQLSGLKNDGRGFWYGMAAMPGAVYGFVTTGIRVVDLNNPRDAREMLFMPIGRLIDADIAYIGSSRRPYLIVIDDTTLRVFDLANPMSPHEVGNVTVPRVIDLAIRNDQAFVTGGDAATQIDLSDPSTPLLRSTLTGLLAPTQIDAAGNRVVIADRYRLLVLRDFVSPGAAEAPQLTLVSATPKAATLSWSGEATAAYEIESTPIAGTPLQYTVRGTSAHMPRNGSAVRVRRGGTCAASAWSNAIQLPAPYNSVRFTSGAQTVHVRRGNTPSPVTLHVHNDATSPVSAILSSERAAAVSHPPSLQIDPGKTTAVTVTFTNEAIVSEEITMTVRDVAGIVDQHVIRLRYVEPVTAAHVERDSLIIPGIGSTPGLNGTVWRSDLTLYCSEECRLDIAYTAVTSISEERGATFELAGGEVVTLPDVANLLGAAGTNGVVMIRSSDLSTVRASAYTYNDGPTGRFGQRIPPFRNRLLGSDPRTDRQILLGIAHDTNSRTNLGFHNPTSTSIPVEVVLKRGNLEASKIAFTLDPFETSQVPVGSLVNELHEGHAVVNADARLIAYASRVDQVTGDAAFSYAVRAPDFSTPPMAHIGEFLLTGTTPGAGDSQWKTNLQLANLSAVPAQVVATFIPTAATAPSVSRTLEIGGAEVLSFAGVSELVGGTLQGVLGTVRVDSPVPIGGWARLFNESSRGTFGQFAPLRDTSPAAHDGNTYSARLAPVDRAWVRNIFPVAESSSRRTNLVLRETSGQHATALVTVYDGSGRVIGMDERPLRPYETLFLQQYLRPIGVSEVDNARLEIRVGGEGRVDAFASVVEVTTNDAVSIPLD